MGWQNVDGEIDTFRDYVSTDQRLLSQHTHTHSPKYLSLAVANILFRGCNCNFLSLQSVPADLNGRRSVNVHRFCSNNLTFAPVKMVGIFVGAAKSTLLRQNCLSLRLQIVVAAADLLQVFRVQKMRDKIIAA